MRFDSTAVGGGHGEFVFWACGEMSWDEAVVLKMCTDFRMTCRLAYIAASTAAAPPRVESEAHARREVMKRDQGQCTNCGSTHAIYQAGLTTY